MAGKWADVEQRLDDWARYFRARADGGLGYPATTITGRLWEQGAGALVRGSGFRAPEINERAEEVEAAVVKMPKRWQSLLCILWLQGSRPSDQTGAKHLGCSVAYYRTMREVVYAHLAGALGISVHDALDCRASNG